MSNKVFSHSCNQISNTLLHWKHDSHLLVLPLTVPIFIFTGVFKDIKIFIFHPYLQIVLYGLFTFYIFLFFVMIISKWILLLNKYVCRVNDSSIRFKKAGTSLLFPIKWKADSRLLTQQLLNDCCLYFISGASVRKVTFRFILALTISTSNFYSPVSYHSSFQYHIFFISLWLTCRDFLKTLNITIRTLFCSCWLYLEVMYICSNIFILNHLTHFCVS